MFGFYLNYYYLCKMRNKTNDTFFDTIDTEIKAYLLGFFIADGTIYQDTKTIHRKAIRLSVGLSERDSKIVNLYKDYICPDNSILKTHYKKQALNRQPVESIRWSSKYMGQVFEERYNIKQRKTLDFEFVFPFELIPDNLHRDFIRGFFDGDGHVSYTEKGQFTFAFYGTSYNFLQQIGEIMSELLNVKYIIDTTKKENVIKLYCLRFNSNNKRRSFIDRLYNWFYNESEFYLERKQQKIKSYLNTVLT